MVDKLNVKNHIRSWLNLQPTETEKSAGGKRMSSVVGSVLEKLPQSDGPKKAMLSSDIIHDSASGDQLESSFTINGTPIGAEQVLREDTVSMAGKQLDDHLAELGGSELGSHKAKFVGYLAASVYRARRAGKTWASSNSVRDLWAKIVKDKGGMATLATSAKSKRGRLLEAFKAKYSPLVVNMRRHRVFTKARKILSTMRTGAITDYRYGCTNMQELIALKALLAPTELGGQQTLVQAFEDQLDQYKEQPNEMKTLLEAAGVHPKHLKGDFHSDTHKLAKRLVKALKYAMSNAPDEIRDIVKGQAPLSDKDWQELGTHFYEMITEREVVLESQFLQVASAHFCEMAELDPEGFEALLKSGKLSLSRVSMLDAEKSPKDPGRGYGFFLNEKNQMKDMEWIYSQMAGRELVFDGKGPYVDKNGKVHLPIKLEKTEKAEHPEPRTSDDGVTTVYTKEGLSENEFKLNTVFFNLSIQGTRRNKGFQVAVNNRGLEQLKGLMKAKFSSIESRKSLENIWAALADANSVSERQAKWNEIRNNTALQEAEGVSVEDRRLILDFLDLWLALADNSKSSVGVALMAGRLLKQCGAFLSVNCFSGKDRTGLFCAMEALNAFEDELIQLAKDEKAPFEGLIKKIEVDLQQREIAGDVDLDEVIRASLEVRRVVRKWLREMMGDDGVASKVIKDNTGYTGIKVSVLKIKGGGNRYEKMPWHTRAAMLTDVAKMKFQSEGSRGSGALDSD